MSQVDLISYDLPTVDRCFPCGDSGCCGLMLSLEMHLSARCCLARETMLPL